ncbi:ADC synthase [Cercophora newfieldiana]|uniref:aminodeoxychorismate synthase n=1 Tax=Cercophora newfieldiana TaxID=92897 RepID=A0AA39YHB4_9PEZI|nr:ADC synthase [Cercophora newfieldiana]
MTSSRPRILFLDAYDSFSNNITALLTTLLDADVAVLHIDSPLLDRRDADFSSRWSRELAQYDAVVCGPGPGSPDTEADVGLMRAVWDLPEEQTLPVLGICLGFQSLVLAARGKVRRLQRGLHGMVRGIEHVGGDVFEGVAPRFKATLYHSLGADVGQDGIPEGEWEGRRWEGMGGLVPLAWVEEERGEGRRERVLMAVRHAERPWWGLQYHPESVCTEEEGNRVIVNWFREARRWNEERGRVRVDDGGDVIAGAATKQSLLSRLGGVGEGRQWWESWAVGAELHSITVPLPKGIQVPDVVEAVELDGSERVVLESSNCAAAEARGDARGRYSIISCGLDEALRIEHHTGDGYATVKLGRVSERIFLAPSYGDIWGFLAGFHEARHLDASEVSSGSPFSGGFMGFITYEQGLHDIGIPMDQPRPHHRPDVSLAWVTKSLVIDHLLGIIHIQHLRPRESITDSWVERTVARLLSPQTFHAANKKETFLHQPLKTKTRRPSKSTTIQPPQTKDYENKVTLCQSYIAAGESYELCLTDQTTITRPRPRNPSPSSPWTLFRTLRTRQPAPFASYLRLGPLTLVSASPERFLQYSPSGLCSMRPMKGTVRKSPAVSTLSAAEQILHVPKEEAENLMIVDLVRHDLHSICGAGRVTAPDLLKVEEYESVFQMITVVEGRLPTPPVPVHVGDQKEKKYTGLDVLAASLPPGSMTGAPKKRSCEILKEIEGGKARSLYSGVVGYMCASGRGDWSVVIRAMFKWDDEGAEGEEVWRIGAGGAVTILSTAEGEREEMFTKLAGPLRVFGEV